MIGRFRALLARLDIHIVLGGDDGDDLEDGNEGEDAPHEDGLQGRDAEVEEALDDHYALRRANGGAGDSKRRGKRRSSFNDTNLEETWVSGGRLDAASADADGGFGSKKRVNGVVKPSKSNGHVMHSPLHKQPLSRGRDRDTSRHAHGRSRARSLSAQSSIRFDRSKSRDRYPYPIYHEADDQGQNSTTSTSDLISIPSSPPVPPTAHSYQAGASLSRHKLRRSSSSLSRHRAVESHSRHHPLASRPRQGPAHSSHPVQDFSRANEIHQDHVHAPRSSHNHPRPSHELQDPHPIYEINIPDEQQLIATADAFYDTTTYRAARQVIHHWHDQSIRQRQMRHDLSTVAANYDRQTLLAQSWEVWRASLQEKREAAETDRFYNSLERRATDARDLFLLNKAFTHWAQSASDEVARTNVARRHILRTRYFNAWRDITAVNELKCRRLGLQKWLPIWRAKTARRVVENERALAVHEEKLVERLYWAWFWRFCEKKAPVWKEDRLKRCALRKLTTRASTTSQLELTAQDMRRYYLARHTLNALGLQGQSVSLLDAQATRHRRITLLSRAFGSLRKHSQLAPRWRQYEQDSSSRLAIKTIYNWSLNTTMSRQAASANQQRLLQNALTKWNDCLRMKVITNMIDQRVKAEAYYKWVLADRLALFRRMMDYRLTQRAFHAMSLHFTEMRFRLDEAEAMCHQNHRRRMLQSAMLKLNARSRNEEHMERQALEFRNVRLVRNIIPTWREKHEHLQQLNRWSVDARFYCLTHNAINCWKEATTDSKRTKRRIAYATIRRRVKVSLVQKCFNHWQQRSTATSLMKTQAIEQYQVRLFAIGTAAFDQWRQMAEHISRINLQAEELYLRRLFSDAIAQLTDKGRQIMQNMQTAEYYVSQTVHAATKSEMMKRMKWQLFCLKRNKESAAALKIRIEEQHRRNMLRYWADQAMRRKNIKTAEAAATAAAIDPESPSKPEVNLFSSLRLPSARKSSPFKRPATTSQLPDLTNSILDSDNDENDEMDFGVSTTRRAEEWTSYDILRDFGSTNNNSLLPTLEEQSEPASNPRQTQTQAQEYRNPTPFATPSQQPGYLRTPSKRTAARHRTRYKALNSSVPPRSTSTPAASSTTAAPKSSFIPSAPNPARPHINNDGEERDDFEAGIGGPGFLASTTPAPFRPGGLRDMGALTPQVTPFERKMRAGGFGRSGAAAGSAASVLDTPGFGRSNRFGRSVLGSLGGGGGGATTGRSVRFFDPGTSALGRGRGDDDGGGGHEKSS